MFKYFNFRSFIPQAINCIQTILETPSFIIKNKLWNGFFEHKGIGIFTLLVSALFSYYLLCDISNFFTEVIPEPVSDGVYELEQKLEEAKNIDPSMEMDMNGLPKVSEELKSESKATLISGGSKYLFLILLEVIIFYFSVKTLAILRNTPRTPGLKDFIRAEKRMIKVMGFNFVKGIVAQVFVYAILGILGFSYFRASAMFLVYSYFIGYAFLDNYNEQFEKTIRQSQRIIRTHLGAAMVLGVLTNVFLYVPFFGPLLVPIIGSIASAIYAERYKLENTKVEESIIKPIEVN